MKTIAITSGKGGVGKTTVSANLGIALSQLGKKVVVFDADLGLADLDIILGESAEYTLRDVARGEMQLWQILQDGPGEILWVPGGSGVSELIDMTEDQMFKFVEDLYTVASYTDILLFDTGAGINRNVTLFLEVSDETLLVLAPDPASIIDAYATVKTLLTRKPDATIKVLVNQVENELQALELFTKLCDTCESYLGHTLNYAGYVSADNCVKQCVRKRKPFVLAEPNSKSTKDIVAVAEGIISAEAPTRRESFTERLLSAFGLSSKAA